MTHAVSIMHGIPQPQNTTRHQQQPLAGGMCTVMHLKCVASRVWAPRLISHSLTAQQSATPSEVEVARPSSSISTKLRGPALRGCDIHTQQSKMLGASQCKLRGGGARRTGSGVCARHADQAAGPSVWDAHSSQLGGGVEPNIPLLQALTESCLGLQRVLLLHTRCRSFCLLL